MRILPFLAFAYPQLIHTHPLKGGLVKWTQNCYHRTHERCSWLGKINSTLLSMVGSWLLCQVRLSAVGLLLGIVSRPLRRLEKTRLGAHLQFTLMPWELFRSGWV